MVPYKEPKDLSAQQRKQLFDSITQAAVMNLPDIMASLSSVTDATTASLASEAAVLRTRMTELQQRALPSEQAGGQAGPSDANNTGGLCVHHGDSGSADTRRAKQCARSESCSTGPILF